ncbi:MAG: hypothetical protein KAH08_05525 [Methylococcales bacterium]|nr:hypothetical protein [Methylococcales bacterium]MCK5898569.1 hypothetical protein [Methylococcales bacterium]
MKHCVVIIKFFQTLLLYALGLSIVMAAEWGMDASVSQDLSYDDNVRMAEDADGSFIYKLSPSMTFFRKTEVSDIHASINYGIQRYLNLNELNSHSQQYSLGGSYLTERTRSAINLFFSINPARDNAEEDSGDFASDGSRLTYSIAPSFSYQLTELDNISFSPNYSKTTYTSSGFSNNTNTGFSLAWSHRWTERLTNSMDVFYTQFDSSGLTQDSSSQSYGANISGNYDWSETWQISASLGLRMTESEDSIFNADVVKSSNMGFLSNFSINYKGEHYGGGFSWGRSLVPSAQGNLNEQDRLTLDLYYKFTQRLSSSFTASYQRSESISSDSSGKAIRENVLFSPTLNWAITPEWKLSMSYRYQLQSRESREIVTDSNAFMLNINYNWQGLSISR